MLSALVLATTLKSVGLVFTGIELANCLCAVLLLLSIIYYSRPDLQKTEQN